MAIVPETKNIIKMSKNNKNVETAQESQTTQKVYKTPTGKTITLEEKKKRREAREQEYQNFRINALRRRAKRMKMSEEDINKAVEALKKQLDTPNNYNILLFFNPNNANLVKEALSNEGIVWKIMGYNPRKESDGYMYIVDADQEVLATIREIVPPGTKIHPYVKKKPSILPTTASDKQKKPSKNSKNTAAKAKKDRKEKKKSYFLDRKNHKRLGKTAAKASKKKSLLELKKKRKATTVQLKSNKRSTGSKKASTTLKQAA